MKKILMPEGKPKWKEQLFNLTLVILILGGLLGASLLMVGIELDFNFLIQYKTRILEGFLMTLGISMLSLVISLLIGFIVAFMQQSPVLALNYFGKIYVYIMRGTPLIMQIYLFYYIIGTAWGVTNRIVAGVIILSVFEGAYIAEIIRGSLLSVQTSQIEAATAVGFTHKQTLRYVILPQMFATAIPALAGQMASIIKDSSLLSIIAVIELTQTMREISADNFRLFESYLLLGLLYLCMTLPVTWISQKLERRFQYENRASSTH